MEVHEFGQPNMRKALQKLRRAYPNLEDCPFEGFGHGEIMANPELMAQEIERFIERED